MVSIGDSISMQNCNHDEEDIRVVVHVLHALKHYVRNVDSYVVVILAGTFHDLVATQPLADMCVAFCMGISRLRQNFCLQRQEVGLAGLAGII